MKKRPLPSPPKPALGFTTGALVGLLAIELAFGPLTAQAATGAEPASDAAAAPDAAPAAAPADIEEEFGASEGAPVVNQPTQDVPAPMPPAMPMPQKNGLGLLITGGIFGGVGLTYLGFTIATLSSSSQSSWDALAASGLGFLSMLHFGIATPMLVVGGIRMQRYRRWQQSNSANLGLHLGRSAHGTMTSGFQIRF